MLAFRAPEKRGAPMAITIAGALEPSQPSEILGMEGWLAAHRISVERPVGPLLPACEAVVVAIPWSVSSRGHEYSRVRGTLGSTSAGGPLEGVAGGWEGCAYRYLREGTRFLQS